MVSNMVELLRNRSMKLKVEKKKRYHVTCRVLDDSNRVENFWCELWKSPSRSCVLYFSYCLSITASNIKALVYRYLLILDVRSVVSLGGSVGESVWDN